MRYGENVAQEDVVITGAQESRRLARAGNTLPLDMSRSNDPISTMRPSTMTQMRNAEILESSFGRDFGDSRIFGTNQLQWVSAQHAPS